MIARLQAEFVPFAGDTHELQNGRSQAKDWFMRMAVQKNERVRGGVTAQGFYVAGADGAAYGFSNHRAVDRMLQLLDKGAATLPATGTALPAGLPTDPRRTPPADVAVVRVFARIRPLPQDASLHNRAVARDHLWLLKDEVAALCERKGEVGAAVSLPTSLVDRLVRYHLLDNIRGEPNFWAKVQVSRKEFSARVLRRTAGDLVLSLNGSFAANAGPQHGIEGTLSGEIALNTKNVALTRFRAYGEAKAWGSGTYTGGAPAGRFGVVFAMVDASDEAARSVPPQGLIVGGDYLRPE